MTNIYDTSMYPLGSTKPKVVANNSSNLDDAMNGQQPWWTDRFGETRLSLKGAELQWNQMMENIGFEPVHLTYVDGVPLIVSRPTQLIDRGGNSYKIKQPAVFPYTLTGVWTTDQANVVQVADASLRSDLVAPPGAGLIGFSRSEVYPTATVGYELLRSLPAFVNARSYGFTGNGTNTDTLKLQQALESGFPIQLDKGTFTVTLAQTLTLEGGSSPVAIVWKTGMVLRGAGKGQTIIKLKDNESTDASPKYFNIIAGNTVISDSHLSDITFDINGQNNKISPSRGSGVYNPYNCAAFFISGRVATVGVDARMIGGSIERIEVKNSPGVTCIATGQQEGSAVMSENVRIFDCDFYNNGIDSADHSSIYMWGNKIWVERCNFDHPTPSTGIAGPLVAAELHGSDNFFRNNNIRNYCQMVWISGNQTGPCDRQHVTDNSAQVTWVGAGLYSLGAINLGLRNVIIAGNTIEILAGTLLHPALTFPKTALYLAVESGEADIVHVFGNTLKCKDVVSNIGVFLGAGSGAFLVDAVVRGNTISGFSRAVVQGGGSAGTCFSTVISENDITNLTPSSGYALPDGIYVSGAHGALTIKGNKISGTTLNRGIFLGSGGGPATLDSLDMDGNDIAANATTPIFDAMVVNGRRQGQQACTFTVFPPTQSTWKIGDRAFPAPNLVFEAGASPNKYLVTALRRVTNGTSNILGTDWLQERVLTGN